MAAQIGRLADFFGAPREAVRQPPLQPIWVRENQGIIFQEEPTINQAQPLIHPEAKFQQPIQREEPPRPQQDIPRDEPGGRVVLVNRNQDADEILQGCRQNDMVGNNNLAALVERIMARNGVNLGMCKPNYTSPFSEYIQQTELPRGWKVPKFTKFSGDTSESTIEHISRYLIEAGDIENNENLRIKYFPSLLTKNACTWFTTLAANSIHDWTRLERLFHEQFYVG